MPNAAIDAVPRKFPVIAPSVMEPIIETNIDNSKISNVSLNSFAINLPCLSILEITDACYPVNHLVFIGADEVQIADQNFADVVLGKLPVVEREVAAYRVNDKRFAVFVVAEVKHDVTRREQQ